MELFPKIMDLITTTTPADTGNTCAANVPPTSTNENQPPRMNGHYNDTDTGTNDMVDAQPMSSPYVMATTTTITTTMKRGKPTTTPIMDNDIVGVAPNDVAHDTMDRTSTMVTVSPRIVNMTTTTIGTPPPPSGSVRRSPRRHHYHDSPTVALLLTTATIAPRSRTTQTIPSSTQKKARTNAPVSTIPIRTTYDDSPMMITTTMTGVLPCSNGGDSDGCSVVVPTPPLPPPNNNIVMTTTTISMTVDQIHSRMYQLFGSSPPPPPEQDASGTTTTTATATTPNTSSSDLIFHRVRCVCCCIYIYLYLYLFISVLIAMFLRLPTPN
jgi:hypothetical protein